MFEINIYRVQPFLRQVVGIWMCAEELSRCADCLCRTLCCRCIDLQPFTNSDDDLHRGVITADSNKFREEEMGRGEPLSARPDLSIDLAQAEGDPDLEERQRRALQFRRQLSLHKELGDARFKANTTVAMMVEQPSTSRAAIGKKSRSSIRTSKINKTDLPSVHTSTKVLYRPDSNKNSSRKLDNRDSTVRKHESFLNVDKRDAYRKDKKLTSDERVDQLHFSKTFHSRVDSCKSLDMDECGARTIKDSRPDSATKADRIDCSKEIAIVGYDPMIARGNNPVKLHSESRKKDKKPKKLKENLAFRARQGGRTPEFPMLVERSEIRRKYCTSRNDDDELVRDHGTNFVSI